MLNHKERTLVRFGLAFGVLLGLLGCGDPSASQDLPGIWICPDNQAAIWVYDGGVFESETAEPGSWHADETTFTAGPGLDGFCGLAGDTFTFRIEDRPRLLLVLSASGQPVSLNSAEREWPQSP